MVRLWMQLKEERMRVVCVGITEAYSGDGYDLPSTLFRYDLRKGDLFVLSWERVRGVEVSLPSC